MYTFLHDMSASHTQNIWHILTVSGQDFFDEMWKNIIRSPAITYDTP